MTVYLVRPQPTSRLRSLNLNMLALNPEERLAQLEEQGRLWQIQESYQDLEKWIKDEKTIRRLPEPRFSSSLGLMFLEIPEDQAEDQKRSLVKELRQKVGATVIPSDIPIDLVEPLREGEDTFKTTLDPEDLWHLEITGIEKVRRQIHKWGSGRGVTVLVLDTGIQGSHAALQGRVEGSYSIGLAGVEQTADLDTSLNQHGTHVAGLICGRGIGVAPEAKMISGVALPQGRGRLEDLIRFLLWVQEQPEIRLINFSGGVDSRIFRSMPQAQEAEDVIDDVLSLGQLIITAAGNKGEDFHVFPANRKGVVAVGATTIENRIASFSGGAQLVMEDQTLYMVPSLVAPGDQIYSCVNDGYMAKSGTSMATPIVTGIAALLLEQQTRISIVELRNRLFELCHDLGFQRWRQGRGLITLDRMP